MADARLVLYPHIFGGGSSLLPCAALAAVVHCLAIRSLYAGCTATSCLELFPRSFTLQSSLSAPDACKGLTAIEQECDHISDRLPGNPEDLWSWCLERSRDELLALRSTPCSARAIGKMPAG
jgi:ParB family transcriptional regulator, chromosome partitioning protein